MAGKEIDRMLPVRLSRPELDERSRALASSVDKLADLERRKKVATAAFKLDLDEVLEQQRQLAQAVRDEAEDRLVKCKWVQVFEQRLVQLVRLDTGEIVESRAMSVEELQEEMFA